MKIRDRIKDFRRVKAADLLPNPANWRTHPEAQQNALRGVLAEVGIAGALIARETPQGLQLIDGHLRADTDPNIEWPVLVLDVDDAEAAKLLATLDPIAAMAGADAVKLDELLRDVNTGDEALSQMLADLADSNGLYQDGQTDGETKLKELNVMPPPAMTWVLLGIPTVRFGEINQAVETLAAVPGIICESTSNDG